MFNDQFSVMILAAGYGKRLKPITNNLPKPLIKIGKKNMLQNTIDHLIKLNFNEIVINTHYFPEKIKEFIKEYYPKKNIFLSYEKELLNTGGGVKNAIPFFKKDKILVLNSDIYWNENNIEDILSLMKKFDEKQKCRMLLISKDKAHGIYNNYGDFIIKNGLIKRYEINCKIFFFAGAQIINTNVLKNHAQNKFSFNIIWDELIDKKLLFGDIMKSSWYHVGDIKGLEEAKKILT